MLTDIFNEILSVVEESQWSDTSAPFWHAQVHSLCHFVRFPNPVALSEWVRTCVHTSYLLPQNTPILTLNACTIDRFTKTFFWNFQNIRADLCYISIYKQMLEKVFCSNIAPSLSSGNHLFYKAEYMGRSCPNQVWAITFDWSALATWNKHFWTAFW